MRGFILMKSLIEEFSCGAYVFEKGDTLDGVAEKFNTTRQVIICDNNLTSPPFLGQAVFIRRSESVITVGAADDIDGICRKYGAQKDEIYRLNKVNFIYPFMRLIVK